MWWNDDDTIAHDLTASKAIIDTVITNCLIGNRIADARTKANMLATEVSLST
jgi:hypothetical protein